ncbi:MAG: DNA alkylation repair protein [Clostridia bacterium]|nr:DNA alkylation repair protein [Clostridia bacterium]
MNKTAIQKRLYAESDAKYRDLASKLTPTLKADTIIGVRTPALRSIAKEILATGDYEDFLSDLPHKYFDENQLHAFIISGIKDFDLCIGEVCKFLPFINNWATCDQMSPKVFAKNKEKLLPYIYNWVKSKDTYTVRFGVGMLMAHYLDGDYKAEYPKTVAAIHSDEYYVNMMCAWYFATALAKQYKSVIPYFEKRKLDKWVHNKAIQKARESYRVGDAEKEYLKTLKIK